jgi:hypothetical protein
VEEHARVRQARKALATATARAQATAASRPTTGRVAAVHYCTAAP